MFQNNPGNRCVRYKRALLRAIVASPKKLRDKLRNKLQRGHVRRCNLPATCLATPLQDKLQIKLHCETLALELSSTFCNDCRDSLKPLKSAARDCHVFFENIGNCSPRLQGVTCLLQLAIDFFFQRCETSCKYNYIV